MESDLSSCVLCRRYFPFDSLIYSEWLDPLVMGDKTFCVSSRGDICLECMGTSFARRIEQ